MKSFYSTLLAFFIIVFSNAQSLELQTKWWQPNGVVKTIVKDTVKNIVYIGGDFDYVGPEQAFATQVNIGEPNVSTEIPHPDGNVLCSVPDGDGGWYVGGTFTKVGDSIRNCIAHISRNGVVTSWNPKMSPDQYGGARVNCILKQGQNIYIGGIFTSIGGQLRNSIACLDSTTASATSWNANLIMQANVSVIEISKNVMYVGGSVLSNVNSPTALVALDLISGSQNRLFSAIVFGSIRDIVVKNDTIIICGEIFAINGTKRTNYAALDANTGQVFDWSLPYFNNNINSLAIKDDFLIVGGSFTSFSYNYESGYPHTSNYLARINMTTGLVDNWNPNLNGGVLNIFINGNNLFITGSFTKIKSQTRYRIAALEIYSGIATNWDFDSNDLVTTISFSNNSMFIGGFFSSIGGKGRSLIAAMDGNTGQATDWNAEALGKSVNAIELYKDAVYVGGDFGIMGGKGKPNFAELSAITGLSSDLDLSVYGVIHTFAVSNDKLYAAGDICLAVDLSHTPKIEIWKTTVDGTVQCIAADGNTIYIGGYFSNVGSLQRKGIAALNAITGIPTDWDPNYMNNTWIPNTRLNSINTIAISSSSVFIGGNFSTIGNNSNLNDLASIDKTTGLLTNWRPLFVAVLPATIKLHHNKLYVGGHTPGSYGPYQIYDLTGGGESEGYDHITNNELFIIQLYGNQLFLGGSFNRTMGQLRHGFSVFNFCTSSYTPIIEAAENVLCPYSKTLLNIKNAADGTSWKWYANNCSGLPLEVNASMIEVSPLTNTTYYVKGDGGCVNKTCQSINISLKTPAFKPVITNTNNILSTDEVANGNYQWINCTHNSPIKNENKTFYTPLVNGSYGVALSKSGCTSISDCISISNGTDPTPTSNEAAHTDRTIKIYPNPTSGALLLDFGQELVSCKVSVVNSTGECIITTKSFDETAIQLNLDKQPSGIYVVIIEKENSIEAIKIIKQ